jgi:hypothetical protein
MKRLLIIPIMLINILMNIGCGQEEEGPYPKNKTYGYICKGTK